MRAISSSPQHRGAAHHGQRKQVEALKKRRAVREAEELTGAQEIAKKLEKTSLAFAVKTGEGGKMFGAITAADIHDKLIAAGQSNRQEAHPPAHAGEDPGQHTVKVKLHAEVTVELSSTSFRKTRSIRSRDLGRGFAVSPTVDRVAPRPGRRS
jgi:ribosomal protein L9